MPADRNKEHLYPEFREKVETILKELEPYAAAHMPGCTWILIEGYRTREYQHELFEKGRTIPPIGKKHIVTYRDGYVHRSNHQSSLAADLAPRKQGVIMWSIDAA